MCSASAVLYLGLRLSTSFQSFAASFQPRAPGEQFCTRRFVWTIVICKCSRSRERKIKSSVVVSSIVKVRSCNMGFLFL